MQRICLCLLLCLALLPSARGESQLPAPQGAVTDLAGVLSDEAAQDISTLSQRLDDAAWGELYVVTRHFLGGADVRAYGQALFQDWDLDEWDALLLLVIGEESYALILGEAAEAALPADAQTSLLATRFRGAYLSREYDAAVAGLLVPLAESLAKAQGESLKTAGLFGQAEIQATPAPQDWNAFRQDINSMWQDMFGETFYEEQEQAPEDSGVSWRAILIWSLVIYFLFFRKRRRYNFGHGPKRKRR